MQLRKWSVNISLVGLLAVSSLAAFASNQQCALLQNCTAQVAQVVSQKNVPQKNNPQKNQQVYAADSLAYYLENLELTPEQIVLLRKVQETQVPMIMLSKRNIEAAHAKLRKMAMKNAYDQRLADELAQVIAGYTANLAVLQAQREYELFSVLSDEQVARYETLAAQFE